MPKGHSFDGWCRRHRQIKLALDPWLVLVRRAAGATATEITGSSQPPATGSHRGSTRRVASILAAQSVANTRSQPAGTILLVEDDPLIKSRITQAGVSGRIAGWMAAQAACDTRIAVEIYRASPGLGAEQQVPSRDRTPAAL
jgi:hypothetical protein